MAEKIKEILLGELHPFPDHPFGVRDDEAMEQTVESIKDYGVLVPAIARPREDGGYEIIAGHRRKHACEIAGLKTMPVIVRDIDRNTATIVRSLSAKAKGILVEMLSLPESWDYTLKGLTTLFSDGIDSIRQGINELEKHGYIVRERKRDVRGRLGGMEYVIYETPHIVREEDQTSQSVENFTPESPEPTTEKPTQDSSAEEMPTVYKELNKYNRSCKIYCVNSKSMVQ